MTMTHFKVTGECEHKKQGVRFLMNASRFNICSCLFVSLDKGAKIWPEESENKHERKRLETSSVHQNICIELFTNTIVAKKSLCMRKTC